MVLFFGMDFDIVDIGVQCYGLFLDIFVVRLEFNIVVFFVVVGGLGFYYSFRRRSYFDVNYGDIEVREGRKRFVCLIDIVMELFLYKRNRYF